MVAARGQLFLYQAGGPPITLGELPVTPVLPYRDDAPIERRELIADYGPIFAHFIPETVIPPCWVQDYTHLEREKPLIGEYTRLVEVPAPPTVRPELNASHNDPFDSDSHPRRLLGVDGWIYDPRGAALIPPVAPNLCTQVPEPILEREKPLIYEAYSPVLLEVVIGSPFVPALEIEVREKPLIGDDPRHLNLPVVVFRDGQFQDPSVSRERYDSPSGDASSFINWKAPPFPMPYIEDVNRDATWDRRLLIAESYQTFIPITPPAESLAIGVCHARSTPLISITRMTAEPLVSIQGASSQPLISIDSVETAPLC